MFRFRSSDNDLAAYRAHYPKKREDANANDNVKFYQNKIRGPEGLTIDELHESKAEEFRWLEYCHSFVQWLFPIQEPGLNPEAQVLMKHEIAVFRSNQPMMQRAWRSFELMVRFYGMRVTIVDGGAVVADPVPSHVVSNGRARMPWHNTAPSSAFQIMFERSNDAAWQQKLYRNLATSPHNYLRITRILKFLGELGMEDVKLAWLAFFAHETYVTRALKACAASLEGYWSGTIYDDNERAAFHSWRSALTPHSTPLPSSAAIPPPEERGGTSHQTTVVIDGLLGERTRTAVDGDGDDEGCTIADIMKEAAERKRKERDEAAGLDLL